MHQAELRLQRIRETIDQVERRCLAADGAVSRFQDEVKDVEVRVIYRLAGGKVAR
jgi:hypothetical protein